MNETDAIVQKLDQEAREQIVIDEKKLGPALLRVTPRIRELAAICEQNNVIDRELYKKYNVNSGLRDQYGKGVLAGLTNVSDIQAKKLIDGKEVPCEGKLYFRGYEIKDIVKGKKTSNFLLLFSLKPASKVFIIKSRKKDRRVENETTIRTCNIFT